MVLSGERAQALGLALADRLRAALPGAGIQVHMGGGSFKSQLKRADKSGAGLALILGDDEVARGVAAIKPLRGEAGQADCALDALPARLAELLGRTVTGTVDGR